MVKVTEKKCSRCQQILQAELFSPNPDPRSTTGLRSACKACSNAITVAYRRTPKGKAAYLKRDRASYHNDPITIMWFNARRRARLRGLEFSIVREDIVVPDKCPVLGIMLEVSNDFARASSPSIDRVDQAKGYTKDNIRVISWRANRLKSDARVEELEAIIRYMKSEIIR